MTNDFRDFRSFFTKAMDAGEERSPFPYQERLATSDVLPTLLSIPTGMGKTAAVVLAWLWRLLYHENESIRRSTPRRLVYCLPMRTLVLQTRNEIVRWLYNLELLAGHATSESPPPTSYDPWAGPEVGDGSDSIRVHMLMGGDADLDWVLEPERPAVLVGTQDMLLSRALNRGFAMSKYRWPMDFGLLNSDSLWVVDEVQLMGSGLTTSAELAGLRELLGSFMSGEIPEATAGHDPEADIDDRADGPRPRSTIWMSATIQPDWLDVPDLDPETLTKDSQIVRLDEKDLVDETIKKRLHAKKLLTKASFLASKDGRKEADLALEAHVPGTLTIVIHNTVARALKTYSSLKKLLKKSDTKPEVLLLHSRFRPDDRQAILNKVESAGKGEGPGTILVTTQVVEAGVDISAATMITDMAPWPSMVQRFGRCNRKGEHDGLPWSDSKGPDDARRGGRIIWIDFERKGGWFQPYTEEQLQRTDELLAGPEEAAEPREGGPGVEASERLTPLWDGVYDASPGSLPAATELPEPDFVPREEDLIDLFDTTADLSGADTDVSAFVRDTDDHNLFVFWRDVPANGPEPSEPQARHRELCPVPLGDLKRLLEKKGLTAWRWDYLDKVWVKVSSRDLAPGHRVMLASTSGGYTSEIGWDRGLIGKAGVTVEPAWRPEAPPAGDLASEDPQSVSAPQTIAEHTDMVVSELETMLDRLTHVPKDLRAALTTAARWHDAGKAHQVFQAMVNPDSKPGLWAKGTGTGVAHYSRPGFRHELASALAMLANGLGDLPAYLAMAHHGKIRLFIRSSYDEKQPPEDDRLFARGVWDGDELPETDLGDDVTMPRTRLTLSYMVLGDDPVTGPSWVERVATLRDDPELGPFRLAYLEALLRAADWRASMKARTR